MSAVIDLPPDALSPTEIASVLEEAKRAQRPAMELLEERSGATQAEIARRLAHALRYLYCAMADLHSLEPAFDLLPFAEAMKRECVVTHDGGRLVAVLSDPFALAWQSALEMRLGILEWRLASRADLLAWLAAQEEHLRAVDGALGEAGELHKPGSDVEDLSLASIAEHASPVVKFVHSTLYDAMKAGASDIHLEMTAGGLQVKYRIDGVLSIVAGTAGVETAEQVISRLKVMAELDIAEKRIPQDGRFKLSIKGREVDYRVSVMPSIHGEDVVVRILDKRSVTDEFRALRLDLLGFDPATLVEIRHLSREPYGMLLVTGPTGSGKTTTLYAALSEINNGQDKIVTIEDPVEYQLTGILQIPVNEKKGLTFARGLRSILRHDPDKILVGEIRDPETAQIAVQSALTGHLVFTSVHANNVFDVLGRFLHMGVDTYSFVSALNGILAQRLVRLVCQHCAVATQPDDEELALSRIDTMTAKNLVFLHGRGCGECRGTGYKGRHAIGEILHLNDELREMVVARAPIRQIKEAARAGGTRFLRESALELLRAGRTTLEEINRVTFVA